MRVLVYLLSGSRSIHPSIGLSPGSPPHQRSTRILLGGRTSDDGDEEHLQFFSQILLSQKKDTILEALHQGLPFTWNEDEEYDVVNPFGDPRGLDYHTLWTFDTQNDMLRFTNSKRRCQMPLSLLRERRVSLDDMELLGKSIPLPLGPPILSSAMPRWEPKVQVDVRIRAFTHRLLRDFHHQWRHILRDEYNTMTLNVLARGIIRISTLDFEIRHNTGGHGPRGVHVWITQLPGWEPFEANLIRIGNIFIVICQTVQEGLHMAQQHLSSRKS